MLPCLAHPRRARTLLAAFSVISVFVIKKHAEFTPYPACVSVICGRMLHWCVGVRIESAGMAPRKAAEVASSHGLPSGSTCGAFLEWSQALGVIYTNPFAELHRHYGPRTTPIVRALVSDDSRGGITGPTPCAAVWKLPRKGDGRARGADALARLSLRRQRRYAAALRSLPAEPCRIGRQAIESAYRSVGSKRSLAKPSVGGEESGTADIESDASARSCRHNLPDEYRDVPASSPGAEAALRVLQRGNATTPKGSAGVPISKGAAAAAQPLYHGGPCLLRGAASGRDRRSDMGRCKSAGRYDRDSGDEILQRSSTPAGVMR